MLVCLYVLYTPPVVRVRCSRDIYSRVDSTVAIWWLIQYLRWCCVKIWYEGVCYGRWVGRQGEGERGTVQDGRNSLTRLRWKPHTCIYWWALGIVWSSGFALYRNRGSALSYTRFCAVYMVAFVIRFIFRSCAKRSVWQCKIIIVTSRLSALRSLYNYRYRDRFWPVLSLKCTHSVQLHIALVRWRSSRLSMFCLHFGVKDVSCNGFSKHSCLYSAETGSLSLCLNWVTHTQFECELNVQWLDVLGVL